MTKDEVIQIFNDWDGIFIGHGSDDVNEALDMAIEALEREKRINEIFDRISKKSIEELSDLSWQEKIVGLLHMVMGSDREVEG